MVVLDVDNRLHKLVTQLSETLAIHDPVQSVSLGIVAVDKQGQRHNILVGRKKNLHDSVA